MRIKPDENLPTSLVEALVQLGHDADCSPVARAMGGRSLLRGSGHWMG
ncbi:MAG TPA: hypothetical protein VL242_53755 [Sorangium sp.]|nr:hypothetical protein [Sorangium sp.]